MQTRRSPGMLTLLSLLIIVASYAEALNVWEDSLTYISQNGL